VFGDAAEKAGRFDVTAGGRHDAGMLSIDLIRPDLNTMTAAGFRASLTAPGGRRTM
jgi:hypothetical protein